MDGTRVEDSLFEQNLDVRVIALWEEVKGFCQSQGYHLSIIEMDVQPEFGINGVTHFSDTETIEIELWPDIDEDVFNLTFAEELIHADQKARHYPGVRILLEHENTESIAVGNNLSTKIMDIQAHRELRERGFSTKSLGMETWENDRRGLFSETVPNDWDEAVALGLLHRALIYVRLYYEHNEDPEISQDIWEYEDSWFRENLPKTRIFALQIITIIQEEGFSDIESVVSIYRRIMEPFDFAQYFAVFGGPHQKPAYIELLITP